MVCVRHIYCREDSSVSNFLCIVVNVPNGILVGYSRSVQWTIVSTGSPAVYFLEDEVLGPSPGAIGTPTSAVSEYFLEVGFRDSEAVWC